MSFAALERELDRWDARRPATLWWRDDDAIRATPALERMLAIAARHAVPLGLAVIPARFEADLVAGLAKVPNVTVLQHGFAHANHAPQNERKAELGAHRPVPVAMKELAAGRDRLETAFGSHFLPVLVPPWNRIAPGIVAALAGCGLRGLSTFGPRSAATIAGLTQCNTHVDPIAWRRGRGFVGADEAAARLASHLAARREGRVDPDEPSGLLTHHLDFTDDAWAFVERLLALTTSHPAARWLPGPIAFSAPTSVRSA